MKNEQIKDKYSHTRPLQNEHCPPGLPAIRMGLANGKAGREATEHGEKRALIVKVHFITFYHEGTNEKRFFGMIRTVACLQKYLGKCLQGFPLTSLPMTLSPFTSVRTFDKSRMICYTFFVGRIAKIRMCNLLLERGV
ncbi:MAG: hypothetical protein GY941_08920 [Planctomycetes bacterium]|nr:hypothetical protein [Planctomycetota bacterium]